MIILGRDGVGHSTATYAELSAATRAAAASRMLTGNPLSALRHAGTPHQEADISEIVDEVADGYAEEYRDLIEMMARSIVLSSGNSERKAS